MFKIWGNSKVNPLDYLVASGILFSGNLNDGHQFSVRQGLYLSWQLPYSLGDSEDFKMIYEDRVPPEEESKAKKAVGKSFAPSVIDRSILKTISYEYPYRPIQMEHTTDEFTCLCPFSELPDQATITIKYVPNKLCIELKSLKYYLYSFRQVRIFHEHVVNKILEDLVAVLDPIEINVVTKFAVRGGIASTATASYKKKQGG